MQLAVLIHFQGIEGRIRASAGAGAHHGEGAHIHQIFQFHQPALDPEVLIDQITGLTGQGLDAGFQGRAHHRDLAGNAEERFHQLQADPQVGGRAATGVGLRALDGRVGQRGRAGLLLNRGAAGTAHGGVGFLAPVDEVGDIEHPLQHRLGLGGVFVAAGHIAHHLLQAVGAVQQDIGGRSRDAGVRVPFEMFQNIFQVVAQTGQPPQADDRPGSFQGMGHAFGGDDVGAVTFAGNHVAHELHQIAHLVGRLLQEAVENLLVGVRGEMQIHVFGSGQKRANLLAAAWRELELLLHGPQAVHDLEPLLLVQRVGGLQ